jgi:hypothetical protein
MRRGNWRVDVEGELGHLGESWAEALSIWVAGIFFAEDAGRLLSGWGIRRRRATARATSGKFQPDARLCLSAQLSSSSSEIRPRPPGPAGWVTRGPMPLWFQLLKVERLMPQRLQKPLIDGSRAGRAASRRAMIVCSIEQVGATLDHGERSSLVL